MSSSHIFLRYTRLTHLYLGVFIAPALLFFAFTGALQTFSLHETTRGSSYKPPAWAVLLAQIHKKQTPIVPVRKAAPAERSATSEKPQTPAPSASSPVNPAAKSPNETAPKPHNALPLKI